MILSQKVFLFLVVFEGSQAIGKKKIAQKINKSGCKHPKRHPRDYQNIW